jgi:MFS family permease
MGMTVGIIMMVVFPSVGMFYSMNVLVGAAQSLTMITMSPFLMENSNEEERTYLFSFSSGLRMLANFVGNWVGGYLPGWMAVWQGGEPTGALAYSLSLGVVSVGAAISVLPLLFLKRKHHASPDEKSIFAPFSYFAEHPKMLGMLIIPLFLTSIGAGLIMPFRNVFYRQVYEQPDTVIGTMFAWGSLAMAIGLMIAPPLADRFGKIQIVVITQALSIPFLALMGFSPLFEMSAFAYYIRLALMNMTTPVYQTFVMEKVDRKSRGTVASLVAMANRFGWAFSPSISGFLQVNYSFDPVFMGTISLYTVSVFLYWFFFWRKRSEQHVSITAELSD